MGRLKTLVVGVLAVFALFALVAGSAFAEEKTKMLPESGVSFTTKSGKGKIEQKGAPFNIECEKNKGSGTITSANLGTYKVEFQECKTPVGVAKSCTGAGELEGVILNAGPFHFWLAKETLGGVVKLVGVLAALPEEVHFTCTVAGIKELVLVKGCVAALSEPLNVLASVTKDIGTQTGGVQLITKVLNTETTEIECKLLSSLNGGEFKQSGLEGTEENEKFENAKKEAITILLMNPEAVN